MKEKHRGLGLWDETGVPLDNVRHPCPQSKLNTEAAKEKPPLRKAPWFNERVDQLLECFLVRCRGLKAIKKETGRSTRGVDTALWKLCAHYPDFEWYTPVLRTDRTGMPFTERDRYILEIAHGPKGVLYGAAMNFIWIGKVMGRSPVNVSDEVGRTLAVKRGPVRVSIFRGEDVGRKPVLTDEEKTRELYRILQGTVKKLRALMERLTENE